MQNHGNTASDYTKILEKTDRIDRAMLTVKGIARVIEADHVLTDSGQEGFIDSYIMSGLTAALDLAADTASGEAASIEAAINRRAIDCGAFDQPSIEPRKESAQ